MRNLGHYEGSKEELCYLHRPLGTVRKLQWGGHAARMGEINNAYRMLAEKLIENSSPRRQRRTRENNIKTDVRVMGCEDRMWIEPTQDRKKLRALVPVVLCQLR